MPNIHETVGMSKPGFSSFDLSHEKKLTMAMGKLVPCFLQEILPNDTFKVKTETMMRMAPMLAPIMHRLNVYVHYFFVPNRIIWPGDETVASWQQFITGGKTGESVPVMPTMVVPEIRSGVGSLSDYFGLPPQVDADPYNYAVSELPFRAYQQIYNDYYRDPNLTDPVSLTNEAQIQQLRDRCWEKDYFTSALPWPQRGPDVSVPVDFVYSDESTAYYGAGAAPVVSAAALGTNAAGELLNPASPGAGTIQLQNLQDDAVQVSINELRTSSAIQRWLEKNARGGYRYIEQLLSHFGVKSSDARLQRAEYLGGGRQPVVISEVLNTSATATEPQGNMSGHGYSVGTTNSFKKRFEEHGWVIGIMSVLPRTAYQQGVHKMFTRTDRYDYYFPEFANLGEQEIANQELYYDGTTDLASNMAAFGYQQRYAEYKYGCTTVHGLFKTDLDFWHLGRIFFGPPALNETFVESDPDTRIFAAGEADSQNLWVQIYNDVKARRPMPYFSNPTLR